MKSWMKWVGFVLVFVLTVSDSFAQCAMCRGTVESTMSNGRNLAATGLNTGILYLLATPYLIVGAIAYLWIRNSKKEHAQRLEIASRVRRVMSQM
ncbi:hypothetical protein [Tellurirhabdus rosea]|uniref:hypothetical protein n=1 Tax=Tellurirhabdus rosea TaxID=2674997 RepID=UPI00225B0F9F|nr:hypothetical protein [Tellurirhabdus rosea]